MGCETGDLSFRSIIEEMMIECCCKNNVCELTLVVMEGGFCLPAPARVVGGLRWRKHHRNYNPSAAHFSAGNCPHHGLVRLV